MKEPLENTEKVSENPERRSVLGKLVASAGLLLVGGTAAKAESAVKAAEDEELRFPGDPTDHNVIYQFNKSDADYHNAVLFSVGAVLRKYGDNVQIVVSCFGPGIHILAKNPQRPVSDEIKQRVASLSQYGIKFHACGQTLKALKWTQEDLLPFASIVDVGAADVIEHQEKGFSYINW